MANNLHFGGSSVILIRDKGTTNTVTGFVSTETVVSKNVTALATNFVFLLSEYITFTITTATSTIAWIKVGGIWKQTTVWIKESGVWKTATPYVKVLGQWE
jgi:hypothetical protein